MRMLIVISAALVALAGPGVASAQAPRSRLIDVPSAVYTRALDINNSGQIVGDYGTKPPIAARSSTAERARLGRELPLRVGGGQTWLTVSEVRPVGHGVACHAITTFRARGAGGVRRRRFPEHAISVRHGCSCAHPLTRLLGVSDADLARVRAELQPGRRPPLHGGCAGYVRVVTRGARTCISATAHAL